MEYQERQRILLRILSHKYIFRFDDGEGIRRAIYTDPSSIILLEANFEAEEEYNRAIEDGMMASSQLLEIMKKKGMWTEAEEKKLETIEKDIEILQSQLNQYRYQKITYNKILDMIKTAKTARDTILIKKANISQNSAEAHVEKFKRKFIVSRCIEIPEKPELVHEDPIIEQLAVLIDRENTRIVDQYIRELARTNPFRAMWQTSQDSGNRLFDHPTSEMTELEHALVMWAMIYDFAYQHSNRPPDDVIGNDEEFDVWYETECRKQDEEIRNAFNKSGSIGAKGKRHHGDFHEVFIPADAEGAKEVYALNSPQAMAQIKERQNALKTKGIIDEGNMPDVQRHVKMKATQELMKVRKK